MVSWADEAASFRDLLASRAGFGFVLCSVVWVGLPFAYILGFLGTGPVPVGTAAVALLLTFPLAYVLQRGALMWVVTRFAVGGFAVALAASLVGAILIVEIGGAETIQGTIFESLGMAGAAISLTAIPAAIAFVAVMVIHGSGGRSEGPDAFPGE